MSALDSLTKTIAAQPGVSQAVEILLAGLADRIRSTSNDQNIQRLARDLHAATPGLIEAIAAKSSM